MPASFYDVLLQQLGLDPRPETSSPPTAFVPTVPLDPSQIQDWRGARNPWLGWLTGLTPNAGMSGERRELPPSEVPMYDSIGMPPGAVGYPWGHNWDVMVNPVRPNTWGAFVENPLVRGAR